MLVNGQLRAEIRNFPILVAAEAEIRIDRDVPLVTVVVFGLPQVGNAFKSGNFALDQVAIQVGVFLMSARAAIGVVQTALQE